LFEDGEIFMIFGLAESDLIYIINIIKNYTEIQKAVIFGSRARGDNKPGSDIDIAIYGDKIDFQTVSSLHGSLEEEGPVPYFFDIVDYTHLLNKEMKEQIDRQGTVIFEK
jgi:predicted nucleotidyltransferase